MSVEEKKSQESNKRLLKKMLIAVLGLVTVSMVFGCATIQKGKGVEHIVLVKLKPDATQEEIKAFTLALLSLADEVPGIVEISAGVNSSPEDQNKGYNYGIIVSFADGAARDVYLTHPNHIKVGKEYISLIEDLLIVDFEH